MAGAWDEKSFCANASLQYRDTIRSLYEAFCNKNGVIMLGGGRTPISNSGLLLLDYARIPGQWKADFRENDRQYREERALYRKLEKESGVFELLENKGKGFFFLGVKGVDEKGNPRWWLNPYDQNVYNAGSFTTEELRQWAEDKGPVIKKARG